MAAIVNRISCFGNGNLKRVKVSVSSKVGKKTLTISTPPEIAGAAQGYHNPSLEITIRKSPGHEDLDLAYP